MKHRGTPLQLAQSPSIVRPIGLSSWLFMLLALPGCELVKGIFKAGVWTGVLGIAVLVGIAFWVLNKVRS